MFAPLPVRTGALDPPTRTSFPPLTVVAPVYVYAPVSTQVPVPDLVTDVTLPAPASAMTAAIVLSPVFVPASPSVRLPVDVPYSSAPVLFRLIGPAPEEASVPELVSEK